MLIFEVIMTRRMVQGGHAVDDGEPTSEPTGPPPLETGGAPPPLPPQQPQRRQSVVRKQEFDDYDDADYASASR